MKNYKKMIWALFICMIMLLIIPSQVNAKATISQNNVTIFLKDQKTLKVKGTKRKIKWITSNKKIVSVNSKGKIVGLKAGKATITAKVGKTKLKCKVTVKDGFAELKKVILKKGYDEGEGGKAINMKFQQYEAVIVYHEFATPRFCFKVTDYNRHNDFIHYNFYLLMDERRTQPDIYYTQCKDGVYQSAEIYTKIKPATYTKNSKISVKTNKIPDYFPDRDWNTETKKHLDYSLRLWNKMLQNKCGLSLHNLGFKKFK